MSDRLKRSRSRVPDPKDPDFLRKYTVPDELLAWTWGVGAPPPPRVVRDGPAPSLAE